MCVRTEPPRTAAQQDAESVCSVSLYEVLDVPIAASSEDIRNAYRKLARLYHPDRHQGDELAKRKFQRVVAAYEVLSDKERRKEYDLNLLDQLDVEDYLSRYQGFILTVCGLGMNSQAPPPLLPREPMYLHHPVSRKCWLTAA